VEPHKTTSKTRIRQAIEWTIVNRSAHRFKRETVRVRVDVKKALQLISLTDNLQSTAKLLSVFVGL
jgi:hypothetical protein